MVAINPNIAAAFAAGRIPANLTYITPEYLSQSRDKPAVIAVVSVCAFTSFIVLLRCSSRLFLGKTFGVDDSLAVFSNVSNLSLAFIMTTPDL